MLFRSGADTVRFFLMNSAEPWQDYDWRADQVGTTRDQLEAFWRRAEDVVARADEERALDAADAPEDLAQADRWLLARLQETVATVTEAMESFETRTASQAAFYNLEEDLRWYRRRRDQDAPAAQWTRRYVLQTRLRLLAPFTPFMANELHEDLTGEPAEDAAWPTVDDAFVDESVLAEERLVEDLTADVNDIVDVTETDPDVVRVYAAADWKYEVLDAVRDVGPDVGQVMSEVMSNPELREKGDAVNDLVQDLVSFVRERDAESLDALEAVDERGVYENAASFLAREFDADVDVYAEDGDDVVDPAGKATRAQPYRPAVHIE